MTDEEAEALLKKLSRHYGQPVMPINRYCEALRTWQRCLTERVDLLKRTLYPGLTAGLRSEEAIKAHDAFLKERKAFRERKPGVKATPHDNQLGTLEEYEGLASSVDHAFGQISKSSLLCRLLYGGEKLRTRACPEHRGHWQGLEFEGNRCIHGCEFTGWIRD